MDSKPVGVLEDLRDADHYARIPESLVFDRKAPHTAIRLYGALDRFLNKKTKACFPGYEKITEKTGMGSATLSRAFKYLERNRFIRVLRSREGTRVKCAYQLMEVRGNNRFQIESGPAFETKVETAFKMKA